MFNLRDHLLSKGYRKSPPPSPPPPLPKKRKETAKFALNIFALGVEGGKVGLLSKHDLEWRGNNCRQLILLILNLRRQKALSSPLFEILLHPRAVNETRRPRPVIQHILLVFLNIFLYSYVVC